MIDRAEREVGEKLGMLLTLHMDPIETDNAKLTATRERIAKAIEGIDSAVHFHDFRMVSGEKNTNLIFDIVVPSGMDEADAEGIKLRIAKAAHNRPRLYRLHGRLKYVKNYCIIEQKYIRRYCLQWNISSSSLKICSPSPAPRASRARLRIT